MSRILLTTLALTIAITAFSQSVGIGTETPDSSAILDLSSTTQGILVPRMTDLERDAINNPADGLLVYVTTDSTFYCFDGNSWVTLNSGVRGLKDADEDTKIMVEATPDEDIIHFETHGVEHFRMDAGRLGVHNTGNSVFIGDAAGMNDDLSDRRNVAVGDSALSSNISGYRNTALGSDALKSNTSRWNTAIGASAMAANTTGTSNSALGVRALFDNTHGYGNAAMGYEALANNTGGNANVAMGRWAMFYNTTGSVNVAIGQEALALNETGSYNVAVGRNALYNSVAASSNTAIGYEAMFLDSTGSNNTAVGNRALYRNKTGTLNTAKGFNVLYYNTSGSYNTALGAYAMTFNSTGNFNDAVGYASLYRTTSGSNNCAFGLFSLYWNTTGSENVVIGDRAGLGNISGNNNTLIGYKSDVTIDSLVNATAIGANAKVSQSHSLILGDSARVGIGTSAPTSKLQVVGDLHVVDSVGIGLADLESSSAVGSWLTISNTSTGGEHFNLISTGASNGEGAGKLLLRSQRAWDNGYGIPITIDTAARVGIQNTNPQVALDVHGQFSAFDPHWNLVNLYSTNALGTWMTLANSSPGGGNFNFVSTGSGNGEGANKLMIRSQTAWNNGYGIPLTIDTAARVGIQNTNPQVALDVHGQFSAFDPHWNLVNLYSSNTIGTWMTLANSSAGGGNFNFISTGSGNGEGADKLLIRSQNAANSGYGIPLTVTSDAFVGVRSTSPIAPLDARSPSTGTSDWIAATFGPDGSGNRVVAGNLEGTATIGAHSSTLDAWSNLAINPSGGNVGIGTMSPLAKMSMGEWNDGSSGDSIQLKMSGLHNSGTNQGSVNGTYKLKIEGYQNDGALKVYPIHVMDENSLVDFYLLNRPSQSGLPTMYFAGEVGIGTETPSTVIGNSKMDVVGGHIAISNNYGVLSYNAANNGVGAGFDTDGADNFIFWAGGANIGYFAAADGSLHLTNGSADAYKPGGGTWTATSDRRLKKNIRDYGDGLNEIMAIRPVRFNYNEKSGYDTEEEFVGVIAQEVNEVAPYMVSEKDDGSGHLQVDNSAMTYMLINAVQEQQAMIDALLEQNKQLEARVASLEKGCCRRQLVGFRF